MYLSWLVLDQQGTNSLSVAAMSSSVGEGPYFLGRCPLVPLILDGGSEKMGGCTSKLLGLVTTIQSPSNPDWATLWTFLR